MSATIETLEAMERPPVSMASRLQGELLEVSMGPQHPSTHGVFRMNVALEGEIVRKLKPVFGYLHRKHEKILDLFESLAGSRMMCDYMRFGGCRVDPSDEWLAQAKQIAERFPKFLDEFEDLILGNEIVIGRTQNVGKLSAELAVNAGITGPMLRACGVNYDIRKVDGYGFYPRFKFRIPLGEHGDTYDRLMMRALEMRESVQILKQAFAQY